MYAGLVGSTWDQVPAAVRAVHSPGVVVGTLRVRHGNGALARALAWILRMPAAGDAVPMRLHIRMTADRMVWRRSFGSSVLTSSQRAEGSWLIETFGPFAFAFSVGGGPDGLRYQQERFGIRLGPWQLWLPRFIGPSVFAECRPARDNAAEISVVVRAPLLGPVLSYTGEIKPVR